MVLVDLGFTNLVEPLVPNVKILALIVMVLLAIAQLASIIAINLLYITTIVLSHAPLDTLLLQVSVMLVRHLA